MEFFYNIKNIVCSIIGIFGLVVFSLGLIKLLSYSKMTKVKANIVDNVQEYTTRGFIWKAKCIANIDGKDIQYITKARSRSRGNGTVTLYVKDGRIIEHGECVEQIIIGLVAIIIAVSIMFM